MVDEGKVFRYYGVDNEGCCVFIVAVVVFDVDNRFTRLLCSWDCVETSVGLDEAGLERPARPWSVLLIVFRND
jgi:hypothetical protein